jgi:hypothetical protein
MIKKLKFSIPVLALVAFVSFSLSAQEEEAAPGFGGDDVKQQWYWHKCELGSSNGTQQECRIVESTSKCGKPAKKRPSGTC